MKTPDPTPTLFPLPPANTKQVKEPGLAKRKHLDDFCARHGILVHFSWAMDTDRYMACLPLPEHVGMDCASIMADSATLYDDNGRAVVGKSRAAVVRQLCELNSIPFDL